MEGKFTSGKILATAQKQGSSADKLKNQMVKFHAWAIDAKDKKSYVSRGIDVLNVKDWKTKEATTEYTTKDGKVVETPVLLALYLVNETIDGKKQLTHRIREFGTHAWKSFDYPSASKVKCSSIWTKAEIQAFKDEFKQ